MKNNKVEGLDIEKKNSFSKILIVILLAIITGLAGYYVGSKDLFEEGSKKGTNKQEKEQLIEDYSFNLKNVACQKEENSCTKELKVSYNNENHIAKVVETVTPEKENATTKAKYTLYIDDKEVFNVDDTVVTTHADEDIDMDGYIYIFDKTYIAFVLPEMNYKIGYTAYVFNSDNSYMRKLPISIGGMFIEKDGKDYNLMDAVEFDGHTLKVWDRDCKDNTKAIQYAITIENKELVFKKLQSVSNVTDGGIGGVGGCKYEKEKIS